MSDYNALRSLDRNVNILDHFPFVKKHPYLTLGILCAFLNFSLAQENTVIAATWFNPVVFAVLAFMVLYYMEKSTEDFVLSVRGLLVIVPVFVFAAWGTGCIEKEKTGIFFATFVAFFALLLILILLKATKRFTAQNALLLLFVTGFVLRVVYALYTPIAENSVRQHDVFRFISGEGDGLMQAFRSKHHEEYIEYIARYLKIPSENPMGGFSQLYHPPLHHIIAALWLKINMAVGMSYKSAVEGIQFLTVFYSSTCMISAYKIFKEVGLKGKVLFRATAIVSLFPWFYLFAGGVNNDILSVALGFSAVLMTIKWYKNPKITNILLVALSLGLSAATKLSMVLLAPAIVFVLVAKLVSVCGKKGNVIYTHRGTKDVNEAYIIASIIAFALIVIPLGISWQVRNAVIWDVPLNYSPVQSATSSQYVGNVSFAKRLFGFGDGAGSNPFIIWGDQGFSFYEYNIFLGGIKTAIFGEDAFFAASGSSEPFKVISCSIGSGVCFIAYIFGIALLVLSVISVFKFFKNKFYGLDKTVTLMLFFICAAFLGNYLTYCFSNPFTCAMNFRHMVPCILFSALALAVASRGGVDDATGHKGGFATLCSVCTKGFLISAGVVYALLALNPL